MSGIVERVARALESHAAHAESDPGGDDDYWRNHARAAIAALREPTEAMLAAWAQAATGNQDWNGIDAAEMRRVWAAVMDAAQDAPQSGKEGGYSDAGPVARPDGGG